MINSGEQSQPKGSCIWDGSKNTLTGQTLNVMGPFCCNVG